VLHEGKAFVFKGLGVRPGWAGMGQAGGIRYSYMYSYTHGVKLNVNPVNMTNIVNYLAVPPTDHLSRYHRHNI